MRFFITKRRVFEQNVSAEEFFWRFWKSAEIDLLQHVRNTLLFIQFRVRTCERLRAFVHIVKRHLCYYRKIAKILFVKKIENYCQNARNWVKGIAII